ncbi:MAG: MFS transporter [Hyphomicrobiales bacterium]|nr:MAG: MFS transporter [Hyphomicrobiales bacterium]
MRLGGRLAAAIEVLEDIERRHRPAADALKDWGLSHRFAGSGDRAAVGNIVYDALRRKRSACWVLDSGTPRALAFGALALEWGMDADALDRAFHGDRFAPQPLDEAERAALSARDLADAPAAVQADCPDWCVPLAEEAFGAQWVAELAALAARPPLDLRVNTLAATPQKVLAELKDAGAAPAGMLAEALRIAPIAGGGRHPNVQAEPAFRKGWFEVQDLGSQIAAALAGAEGGMQVLDYCAGAGGKTLALAAAMDNRGQIFAHDAEKQRLAPIFERLRRAGARNVQAIAGEAGLAPLGGRMDLVLVDAPCTGSGTWRRRPDAKWRLTERQLQTRMAEQAAILDAAAAHVRPGGRLVYVTCSIFPAENARRTEAFLAANPAFAVLEPQVLWRARFGEAAALPRISGGGLVMTPAGTGTDGFFVAVLERGPG